MSLFSKTIASKSYTIPLLFISSLLTLNFIGIALSSSAQGASAADWHADNIIDDSIFYNNSDMSANDIQTFLNNVLPVCDTWGQQMYNSQMTRAQYGASRGSAAPYICVKDYYENPSTHQNNLNGTIPPGATSAAGIIKHAADTYRISARVLIVLLQKEQALITDDWPWPIQYRSATGYGCPDTAPCDTDYYGFYNQVMNAARQFRLYTDNPASYRYKPFQDNYIQYNPNSACGGSTVYIKNRATAALYNYTPYQPNQSALNNLYGSGDNCGAYGNRNFWRLFTDWFGKTTGTFLLQSPRSSTVFLQSGSTRYAIPSGNVLWAYGFNTIPVTPVSDSYIDTLTDGGTLGTLFRLENNSTVYLADNGYRFGIASAALCANWGLPDCTNSANVKVVNSPIFSHIKASGDLKNLALNGSSVYLMNNGMKQPFLTTKAITERGYSSSSYTPITNPVNFKQPVGNSLPQNNSFVQFKSGSIFIFSNNLFYSIPNFSTFKGWYGLSSTLQKDAISLYNTSPPSSAKTISRYIFFDNGKKYLLDNGKKIDITQVSGDWPDQINFTNLSTLVNSLPLLGTATATSTYQTELGMIYRAESKAKKPFNSLVDYFGLGYTEANIIKVSTASSENLSPGPTLFASGYGSLFKTSRVSQENTIFTSTSGGTSCTLSSTAQLRQFRFNAINVPRVNEQTAQSFSNHGILKSLVKAGDGSYWVIDGASQKYSVSLQTLATWGVDGGNACTFENAFLNKLNVSNKALGRFVKDPGGTIFYGDSGQKHPISSYKKYLELGGTASNTFTLPSDFLQLSPTGNTY